MPVSTRDELIARGMPIVRRIAYARIRWMPPTVERGDLIGAGHEGLLKAVQRFDPERGLDFDHFAAESARNAMRDASRADDVLTRYGRARVRRIARASHELRHELERAPTNDEVAQRADVSHELLETLRAVSPCIDLDPDDIPDEVLAPDAILIEREQHRLLLEAMGRLEPRERAVVEQYFWHERTQVDIGRELGVTESRVCQVLGEAAKQLRSMLDRTSEPRPARATTQSMLGIECAPRLARAAIQPEVVELLPANPRTRHIGQRYGAWTVIGDAPSGCDVMCRCDCGYRHKVRLSSLRRGDSSRCKSCAGMQTANALKTRVYAEIEQRGHVLVDEHALEVAAQ